MEQPSSEIITKFENLKQYLKSQNSIAIAFSGGVDSTFLLKAAKEALGEHAKENLIAVTAKSHSFPERERKEAEDFCKKEGIRHLLVESEELSIEGFSSNPINRCYLCKKELFQKIRLLAKEHGIAQVAEGSNVDDEGDYRPGLQAVSELGVLSPLRTAGLNKQEIRTLSKWLGLPTWDKQSFACLSSRFVYGETITPEKLSMVDRAEQYLLDLGFHQLRVRIHGENLARIEVMPQELETLLKKRDEITKTFTQIGFLYVTMDLKGYRTGSMNEVLNQ